MTETDSPAPKFRRRAEDRPDELLDAARDLFLAQGYAATSVAQIAKAAGISKGALYLYFPSKQAVLEGLVKRALVPISGQAIAQAALAHGDLRAALSGFLHIVAAVLGDPEVFAVPRIVIREAVAAPDIAEMYRKAVLDAAIPGIAGVIREGVARGQIRPVDPELTVRTIMGPVILHIMLSEVFGIAPPDGLALNRLIDNHLDILTNGLFAAPEGPQDA